MKNFIFGVLSTFGILALCSKCYDKGVKDTVNKNTVETKEKKNKK